MKKPSLIVHEWLAILAIVSMLGSFIAVTAFQRHYFKPTSVAFIEEVQMIEVSVTGAVQHPGTYTIPQGTLLKELLSKVSPLDNSNLSRLKPERVLRNGQRIHVPKKRKTRQNGSHNKELTCKTSSLP